MNANQLTDLDLMQSALDTLRSRMNTRRELRVTRDQMKECALIFLTGLQSLIYEEGADGSYLNIEACSSDVESCFSDEIEREDAMEAPVYTQRMHGTYSVRNGSVA